MSMVSPSLFRIPDHPNTGSNITDRNTLKESIDRLAEQADVKIKYDFAKMGENRDLFP